MAHDLSDNESEWPRDPYELLGIERTSDERTIRRAYANLIRRFKPENTPAQFQRIREAFESCLDQVRTQDGPGPEADEGSAFAGFSVPADDDAPSAAAWKLAADGRFADAMSRLETLHRDRPDHAETRRRLYWLKRLRAAGDLEGRLNLLLTSNERPPNLRDDQWVPQYIEELHSSIAETTGDRCANLLQTASSEWGFHIARLRWRTLTRERMCSLIDRDLDRLVSDHLPPQLLTAFVLEAAEYRLWDGDLEGGPFWERWRGEMQHLLDASTGNNPQADRWDMILEFVDGRRNLYEQLEVTDDLIDLWALMSHATVASSFREVRRLIAPPLQEWLRDPAGVWSQLHDAYARSPLTVIELLKLIEGHPRSGSSEHAPSEVLAAIFKQQVMPDRFAGWTDDQREHFRLGHQIFEFCMRNAVPFPTLMASIIQAANNRDFSCQKVAPIQMDLPLRVLIGGCQLFWAL